MKTATNFYLILVFLNTFYFTCVKGQYGDPFLGKAIDDNTDADGIIVNPDGSAIQILENRPWHGDDRDFIAEIKYNGLVPPEIVFDVEDDGNRPQFTIRSGSGNNRDKFYLHLNNSLEYDDTTLRRNWNVRLNPPAPNHFAVSVLDVNDQKPYFTVDAPTIPAIVEEEFHTRVLAKFEATDDDKIADANQLRYWFIDLQNGDDATPFQINDISGELSLKRKLDYETQNTYRLQLMVNDSDSIHSVASPIITIIDVEDIADMPPKFVRFEYLLEIVENNTPGSTDNPLFTYRAIDDDFGINSNITYKLDKVPDAEDSGPNPEDYLAIDPSTGAVWARVEIDAELLNFTTMEFQLTATEIAFPNNSTSQNAVLRIIDENDNSPAFPDDGEIKVFEKSFNVTILENHRDALPGLDNLTINDADKGLEFNQFVAKLTARAPTRQTLIDDTFLLSPESGYGGGQFSVRVNPSATIDYEDLIWLEPIEFDVHVQEVAFPNGVALGKIRLIVQDINDNAPEFINVTDGEFRASVSENLVADSYVTRIRAVDNDVPFPYGNGSLRYTFANKPSHLYMDPDTGDISVDPGVLTTAFDRELLDLETYIVQVTDSSENSNEARMTTTFLHLTITDVNDRRPVITSTKRQIEMEENSVPTDPIFDNIQVSDPDLNPTLVMDCTITPDEAASWFQCNEVKNSTTGYIDVSIVISNASIVLDYEKTNRVDITITANDIDENDAVVFTTTEVFTIYLKNINDESPQFEPLRNISVRETPDCTPSQGEDDCETEYEREIYQFRVTDLDTSPDEIWFKIEEGEWSHLVDIDPSDGMLRRQAGELIDREELAEFYINVTAMNCDTNKENCSDHLSNTLRVLISVEDINDERPQFVTLGTEFDVSEGAENGHPITTFFASDADNDTQYRTVNYFLHEESDGHDKFHLDSTSGVLSVKSELDREDVPFYVLRIIARDNAGSRSQYNQNETTVNITLLDENDETPEFSEALFYSLEENQIPERTVLGRVVVTDADEENNRNSIVNVYISGVTWDCLRCDDSSLDWRDFFTGDFNRTSDVFTVTAARNFYTNLFFGIYNITIHAIDQGEDAVPVNETYQFTIVDVNDNDPVFIYPEQDGSTDVYVIENHARGQLREYIAGGIGAYVPNLRATDEDDVTTTHGQVTFTINPQSVDARANQYFGIQYSSELESFLVAKETLVYDENNPSAILVQLVAENLGGNKIYANMSIMVVPAENKPPVFTGEGRAPLVQFEENNKDLFSDLPIATDPNHVDGLGKICYFIIQTLANNEALDEDDDTYPFQLDANTNKLTLRHALDRETVAFYHLVVVARDEVKEIPCRYPSYPPNPDDESASLQRVNVTVLDIKDTAPHFENPGALITGGIRSSNSPVNTSTSIVLRGSDPDVDDPVTFHILIETLDKSGTGLEEIDSPAFWLSEGNEIFTTFLANQGMNGHFTFNVSIEDSVGNNSIAQCKVFFTTNEHEAKFLFDNEPETFTPPIMDQAKAIMSSVFGYRCNIDSVNRATDGPNALANKTDVRTHFVNDDDQPVDSYLITDLPYDNPDKFLNLTTELKNIGLNLDIASFYNEETEDSATNVLTYVLVGTVGVLVVVLLILSVSCWFNSRRLSLRVRALSADTFGSQASGLNRTGTLELPNTNQHAVQGSNPIWTTEGNAREFDTESIGSGGSILIGLENDEDFRHYSEPTGQEDDFSFAFGPPRSQGMMNPLFGERLDEDEDNGGDQASETPLPAMVGRRNPLLMMTNENEAE